MTTEYEQIAAATEEARRELIQAIDRGLQVEAFLTGPVGRFLALRAERERLDVLEKLAEADPEDAKSIRRLQSRVAVLDCWQDWIAEAIAEGRQAQHAFVDLGG